MITNIKDKYTKIRCLGEGTYGKVYCVKSKQSNSYFALKKVKNESDDIADEGIPSTSLREIVCLKSFNHPNIVRYFFLLFLKTILLSYPIRL